MGNSLKSANFLIESRLRDAARGEVMAYYDLGVAYSTGTAGVPFDLIEAHKWFNLAAITGDVAAQTARAEIAGDMSARDVAIAQRAARDWLGMLRARAA
ncbi:MAG: hypothetical protein P0Y64_10800 [Candidatus Sphingomonas colombiensis]|nr:hypothetical protein [Sphingomonas sp.]WEK41896.1 MAG: hypothetical protein P0Y64_10800 [Sphingomonas sp.]